MKKGANDECCYRWVFLIDNVSERDSSLWDVFITLYAGDMISFRNRKMGGQIENMM